jgi:hypothetical protein
MPGTGRIVPHPMRRHSFSSGVASWTDKLRAMAWLPWLAVLSLILAYAPYIAVTYYGGSPIMDFYIVASPKDYSIQTWEPGDSSFFTTPRICWTLASGWLAEYPDWVCRHFYRDPSNRRQPSSLSFILMHYDPREHEPSWTWTDRRHLIFEPLRAWLIWYITFRLAEFPVSIVSLRATAWLRKRFQWWPGRWAKRIGLT